jgi:hypothetical protein
MTGMIMSVLLGVVIYLGGCWIFDKVRKDD